MTETAGIGGTESTPGIDRGTVGQRQPAPAPVGLRAMTPAKGSDFVDDGRIGAAEAERGRDEDED